VNKAHYESTIAYKKSTNSTIDNIEFRSLKILNFTIILVVQHSKQSISQVMAAKINFRKVIPERRIYVTRSQPTVCLRPSLFVARQSTLPDTSANQKTFNSIMSYFEVI
jgi:hypothetical protein